VCVQSLRVEKHSLCGGRQCRKAKCVYRVSEWKSTVCAEGVSVEKAKCLQSISTVFVNGVNEEKAKCVY
jgi:hypothetical protein